MKAARNFRDYKVWQDAVAYASEVYKVSATLPYFERKGLCDQLQRAVVSISSNIAEGSAKPSNVEFAHYLDTALGSAYEVETQLLIANRIGYFKNKEDKDDHNELSYEDLLPGILDIEKQLAGLIRTLRT